MVRFTIGVTGIRDRQYQVNGNESFIVSPARIAIVSFVGIVGYGLALMVIAGVRDAPVLLRGFLMSKHKVFDRGEIGCLIVWAQVSPDLRVIISGQPKSQRVRDLEARGLDFFLTSLNINVIDLNNGFSRGCCSLPGKVFQEAIEL